MKFPIERARIYNIIKLSLRDNDYGSIFNLKNELFDLYENIEADGYYYEQSYNALILSAFKLEKYEDVILIYEQLNRLGFESYAALYYSLLAVLAINDVYKGISLIKKTKIVNTPEMLELRVIDGANYSAVVNYEEFIKQALVMCNFIEGIVKETIDIKENDYKYLIIRSFELVDTLFSLGYDDDFILELNNFFQKVYFDKQV